MRRFRHSVSTFLQTSPWLPWFKTIPAGSAHNPYSRVLEGHHLSIRPASRAHRARKSPGIVDPIGWLIRNAMRPVSHKGNSSKKEKEPKKKKKTACGKCRSYGNPQKQSVAFGSFFLMRIPTAAWKSLEGFSTFTTGPTTIINKERTSSLKTIRGGCAIKKKGRLPCWRRRGGGSNTEAIRSATRH